jgi:hypothetical protein
VVRCSTSHSAEAPLKQPLPDVAAKGLRVLFCGINPFFVDNAHSPEIAARNHRLPESGFVMDPVLNDGRKFRVVKVFYEPEDLERRLAALGWAGSVRGTGEYFVYGDVRQKVK